MTGPEQRVLSGYHKISQQRVSADSSDTNGSDIAEDESTDCLTKLSEQEIIDNGRELKRESQRYISLNEEIERSSRLIEEETKQCHSVEQICAQIDCFTNQLNQKELSIDEVLEKYDRIRSEYPLEFDSLKLHQILSPKAVPLIRRIVVQWKPLDNCQSIKQLFVDLKRITSSTEDAIYESLLWEIWMPVVRRELCDWPSVRQCDQVIAFLESWRPLLPEWLFDNIVEQIVLPLLQKEVEEWSPLTDTVPIHSWLHPWLPLMADRSLEHLYDPIRHKLSTALTNWHPSDSSAKLMLEPWEGVFSAGAMEAFLNSNIVPKLEIALKSLLINPHQQCLHVWHWVMSWQDLLSTHVMAAILEKHFFPRWLSVLHSWLSNRPNFDEVSKWYSGWKSMLSTPLQNHTSISYALKRALDMMNHSTHSSDSMKSFQPFYPPIRPPVQNMTNNAFGSTKDVFIPEMKLSFRQMIESRAEVRGILFMPIANRFHEGKQVFKMGGLAVHIDNNVIFVLNNNTRIPSSLQSLIDSVL